MDFTELLVWLSGAGGVIGASWILEMIEWYHNQTVKVKKFIFFGVSILISASAWAINTFVSPDVISALAPVVAIIVASFTYVFVGESFHKIDKVD